MSKPTLTDAEIAALVDAACANREWTCDVCGDDQAPTAAKYLAKGALNFDIPAPGFPGEKKTVERDGIQCACCAGECGPCQECCDHDEHDHGHCLSCEKDVTDELIAAVDFTDRSEE